MEREIARLKEQLREREGQNGELEKELATVRRRSVILESQLAEQTNQRKQGEAKARREARDL
jgi:hypothetical protein